MIEEHVLIIMLILLGLAPAFAQTTYFNPVPNVLANGTLAKSSDVNGNFAQLVTDGNNAKAAIQTAISGIPTGATLPSGAVVAFDVDSCPSGFQRADGSTVSGGVGIAPDVRGLFIRGLDQGVGRDPGRTLGSYQVDALLDHTHHVGGVSSIASAGSQSGGGTAMGLPTAGTGTIPLSSGAETRPAAVILLQCYKP